MMEHYVGEEGKITPSAVKVLNTQHDVGQSSVYNYLLGITDYGGVFTHSA